MAEEHRKRKEQFFLKLYPEEKELLKQQSEKFGMSNSEFLRSCILFGGVYSSKRMNDDMKKSLYELNRIGNNINQIAYNANSKKVQIEKN